MSQKNIINIYTQATLDEVKAGMSWYGEANQFCKYLADNYKVSLEQAVSVVAHLSPRNRWDRNKLDAEALIAAETWTAKFNTKVATFNKNKDLAIHVLSGKLSPMPKGRKTSSFYLNILGAEDVVTVDTHAYSIYKGERLTNKAINKLTYNIVESGYRSTAKLLGMKPYQLQACTWVTFRRLHNI